jgi:hypothetical protein
MDDVRILRLQSGEDIIAKYKEVDSDAEIVLIDPMTILFKTSPEGKAFMMMSPWLPIEIIEDNVATIFVGDIVTMLKPKKSVVTYYRRIANETNVYALQSSSQMEKSLLEDDNEAFYEDTDEEEIEEYMYTRESKNQLLH